jgi:ketosteroid isomerase-like protein
VDQEKHSGQPKDLPSGRRTEPSGGLNVQDFIRRLRSEASRPQPGQEKVDAALEAAQRIALQMDAETVSTAAEAQERRACHACGNQNPLHNRFCAHCGVPLESVPEGQAPAPGEVKLINPLTAASGQHHYHHHYHHHYFAASDGVSSGATERPASVAPVARETSKGRTPGAAGLSRTEAALRKLAQDWALACNTKHLDDLVELYTADALVLRPNVPPVRSTAAIRELFFTELEAGLGEVELEPLRVEIFGDIAYEVGRCSMLVPAASGGRREGRGKYVIVAARHAGEWKILLDCWSADLSLGAEGGSAKAQIPGTPVSRPPTRSA